MLVRIAFTSTALFVLQCFFATVSVAQIRSSLANESSYALAAGELAGYCIAEFCLGATINEVSTRGKISFHDLGLPDGKLTCSDGPGNWALGDMVTKDGRVFEFNFSLVSTTGKPELRYRLTSIKVKLPTLSELQVDHLRQTLTTRYDLRKYDDSENQNLWLGQTKSGKFSIFVQKSWAKPDFPPAVFDKVKGLSLSAQYTQKKEWLMSRPECRSGLPKI